MNMSCGKYARVVNTSEAITDAFEDFARHLADPNEADAFYDAILAVVNYGRDELFFFVPFDGEKTDAQLVSGIIKGAEGLSDDGFRLVFGNEDRAEVLKRLADARHTAQLAAGTPQINPQIEAEVIVAGRVVEVVRRYMPAVAISSNENSTLVQFCARVYARIWEKSPSDKAVAKRIDKLLQ